MDKLREIFWTAVSVPVMIGFAGYATINDKMKVAEDRRTGASNGVDDRVESTTRIKIDGLENEIFAPIPTQQDLKWSEDFYQARNIVQEIKKTVRLEQHWRTWFLINRPARHTSMPGSHDCWGFDGNSRLREALGATFMHDNVTAAYYFLKFAETKPTTCFNLDGSVDDFIRDSELRGLCYNALPGAVKEGADKIVRLLLASGGSCDAAHNFDGTIRTARAYESIASYQKDAILAAVRNERFDYLDLFLEKGMNSREFLDAYRENIVLKKDRLFGDEGLFAEQRADFMKWLDKSGLADAAFKAEVAALESAEQQRRKNAPLGPLPKGPGPGGPKRIF